MGDRAGLTIGAVVAGPSSARERPEREDSRGMGEQRTTSRPLCTT